MPQNSGVFMRQCFIALFLLCSVLAAQESEMAPFLPEMQEWHKRVYLATYPRSGNHWVRFLLEDVTGLATSSVYVDGDVKRSHLGKPFPWGGYAPPFGYEGRCKYPKPKDNVVVKTHYPAVPAQKFDRMPYVKAIRIVRHPVDSLYSFYLFGVKGKAYPERMPLEVLKKRIRSWKKFHEYWNAQENVLTVRYEDLLVDPYGVLQQIVEAIGYDLPQQKIDAAIKKYPPQGSPMKHIHRFEKEDLDMIARELGDLMRQFDYFVP